MKDKTLPIVLVVVIVLLGVGLLLRHNSAVTEKEKDTAAILNFSNTLKQTESKLEDQKKVNTTLETNLVVKTEEARAVTNQLLSTQASLDSTKNALAKSEAEARAAAEAAARALAESERVRKEEVAKRDARITELEQSQDDLTRKITGLNTAIGGLNQQIARTEKELASTKGDKEFLLKELKRLQFEKSQMEKEMNDLAFLREQVSKLKSELSIAKRLDWIRRGIYDRDQKKGGQLLNEGLKPAAPKTNAPGSQLNVELKRDGSVTIRTNAPGTNAVPPAPVPK